MSEIPSSSVADTKSDVEPKKGEAKVEETPKKSETGVEENATGNSSLDESVPALAPEVTLDEYCVYMSDLAKDQKESEMEAMIVLGGSDENNCTYSKGYIKRQALYSCLTCVKESKDDPEKRAGICLACSLTCHENHDLIELYTKRNFRCDCGGTKMKNIRCQLEPIKFGISEDNKYNQNFSGVYCTCKRPYPDPEDNVVDDMIQCVICEDWYHGRHLNTAFIKDFYEMVCGGCVGSHDFLKCYLKYSMAQKQKAQEDVDIETEAPDNKRPKLDPNACNRPAPEEYPSDAAIFWDDDWRDNLCKCPKCLELYKEEKVEFLIDPEDPVQKYEEIGLQRNRSAITPEQREIEALSTLGRTQQVEMITGYNRFRDKLKEFLHGFAVSKKTVTEEDVNTFFAKMKEEKAEKQQEMGYFCR